MIDIDAVRGAIELVGGLRPETTALEWEEDESGVVFLSHQDGTPWGFMPRADFDRLRKHATITEEKP